MTEKKAVFTNVYPNGFPMTKYFSMNRNKMNVLMQMGFDATGRALKHRASELHRSSHTGPVPSTVALSRSRVVDVLFPKPGISRASALLTLQSYRATQLWLSLSSARPVVLLARISLSPLCTALPSQVQARQRPDMPVVTLMRVVITSMVSVPKNRGNAPACYVPLKQVFIKKRTMKKKQQDTRMRPEATRRVMNKVARTFFYSSPL